MALLIAIVVATATLVGQWVGPFTEQQTEQVEEQASGVHDCAEVRIAVLDVHHEGSEARITVMNAGFTDLPNLTAVLLGEGEVIAREELMDLPSGEITSAAIDVGTDTPETVTVVSPICPMITDEESF